MNIQSSLRPLAQKFRHTKKRRTPPDAFKIIPRASHPMKTNRLALTNKTSHFDSSMYEHHHVRALVKPWPNSLHTFVQVCINSLVSLCPSNYRSLISSWGFLWYPSQLFSLVYAQIPFWSFVHFYFFNVNLQGMCHGNSYKGCVVQIHTRIVWVLSTHRIAIGFHVPSKACYQYPYVWLL